LCVIINFIEIVFTV